MNDHAPGRPAKSQLNCDQQLAFRSVFHLGLPEHVPETHSDDSCEGNHGFWFSCLPLHIVGRGKAVQHLQDGAVSEYHGAV